MHTFLTLKIGPTKSNFSIIEKDVQKARGPAAVLGAEKGFGGDIKVEKHWP